MKKALLLTLFGLFSLTSIFSIAHAEQGSRGDFGSDPVNILDNVKKSANEEYKIQETALDNATDTQGAYQRSRKISNTLDYIRTNISTYLQWLVYLGLTLAVIGVIYNGLMMVIKPFNKSGDIATVKKNIVNIAIGVIILTGFYAIIKIMVSVLNMIFAK